MKNAFFIICSVLFIATSCERIDSHYTYEATLPGTNVKENQLYQNITFEEFQSATEGVRYEYVRPYPCIIEEGKVYYSLGEEKLYSGPYTRQVQFEGNSLHSYTFTPGYMDVRLTITDYTFDADKLTLHEMEHPYVTEGTVNKLIYVSNDYLIFETNGIADEAIYYTDKADFCRVVYKRTDDLLIHEVIL